MAAQKLDFRTSCFGIKIYFLIFLLSTTILAHSQSLNEKEKLTPPKLNDAINIDGILHEPVWQKTRFTKEVYDENGRYYNTEAYFTYDADNLYAGFICRFKRLYRQS